MKRLTLPLSALLACALPLSAMAQSASSVSSSSMSAQSSMSSQSSLSSLSSSSMSNSSLSSSLASSRSSSLSSRSSSRMSSSVSSGRLDFEEIDLDRYDDTDIDEWDRSTSVAVSALTRIGVLLGNDDGTFRADRTLNRAEFVSIIIRLSDDDASVRTNCFVDIVGTEWFAEAVCRAKAMGLVRGNAQVGVPESQWRFEPARPVQYEEAVKILAKLYALPVVGDEQGMDWYVPFIKAAQDTDLVVEGLEPGDHITRGEMARLTVAFVAEGTGQLAEFRDAEQERSSRSSSKSSLRNSASSRSSVQSGSSTSGSSRSSSGSGVFDSLNDTVIKSNILVVGEVSPILAGLRFFSNAEPISVTEISVQLSNDVDSIASILIYAEEDGQLLGTATSTSNNNIYTARIPSGRFELPRREDMSMYLRARLNSDDNGGLSGEEVKVDSVTLRGNGVWTNDDYATTSSDTFPLSSTALGRIISVRNTAPATAVLTGGSQRLLGQFEFTANAPDSQNDVRVTALRFDIEQAGGIGLSNVYLTLQDSSDTSNCSISSGVVTCASIPASIGTLDDTQVIRVYGDISVPTSGGNQSLRLVLSDPGTTTTTGDISWTDGVTTFDWIQLDQPIVGGTQYQ